MVRQILEFYFGPIAHPDYKLGTDQETRDWESNLHGYELKITDVLLAGVGLYIPFREVTFERSSFKRYFPACQLHHPVRTPSVPVRYRTGVDDHLTIIHTLTCVDSCVWRV